MAETILVGDLVSAMNGRSLGTFMKFYFDTNRTIDKTYGPTNTKVLESTKTNLTDWTPNWLCQHVY